MKDTASAMSEKAIQATFFEIKLNEVKKADFFKAG